MFYTRTWSRPCMLLDDAKPKRRQSNPKEMVRVFSSCSFCLNYPAVPLHPVTLDNMGPFLLAEGKDEHSKWSCENLSVRLTKCWWCLCSWEILSQEMLAICVQRRLGGVLLIQPTIQRASTTRRLLQQDKDGQNALVSYICFKDLDISLSLSSSSSLYSLSSFNTTMRHGVT